MPPVRRTDTPATPKAGGKKTPLTEILIGAAVVALLSVIGITRWDHAIEPGATQPAHRAAHTPISPPRVRKPREICYPRDGFAMRFPVSPRRVVTHGQANGIGYDSIQYHLEQVGIPGAYLVTVTEVPPGRQSSLLETSSLRPARDRAVNALRGATVLEERDVTLNGHPGLESQFQTPEGEISYLLVYAPPRMYQVIVGKLDAKHARSVVRSFRLLDEGTGEGRAR